jgi:hypothetical protein
MANNKQAIAGTGLTGSIIYKMTSVPGANYPVAGIGR